MPRQYVNNVDTVSWHSAFLTTAADNLAKVMLHCTMGHVALHNGHAHCIKNPTNVCGKKYTCVKFDTGGGRDVGGCGKAAPAFVWEELRADAT